MKIVLLTNVNCCGVVGVRGDVRELDQRKPTNKRTAAYLIKTIQVAIEGTKLPAEADA